ncbi:hypothetical protein [Limnoglobus roseus]|uniref:TIGR03067 domain-containing protein n=1 Tax=Limnoglobus roseus TaxID=2598579 RepID=A0A5C1AQP1_9BACT|nr:hypothetical protein [Limnoglobus roseus]QEL20507.1 hypothetical protein PX52LOC_07611 [Limnoglobus roseus]
MLSYLLGTVVALGTMLSTPAAGETKGPEAKCLDGAWTVVCYEKGGEAQADSEGMAVKADSGTITCAGKDGKAAVTMKVVFAANGVAQVTEMAADGATTNAKAGVYVLTADYLAISLNAEPEATASDATGNAAGGSKKSRCSIILKRDAVK